MRSALSLIVIGAVAVLAGCGGGEPGPPTTTAATGVVVGPDRYLADAAAGAAAVRTFVADLTGVGSPATPERLKAIAPLLEPSLTTATLVGQRLTAERLADRRLEAQRERSATSFEATVAAMGKVHAAAVAGDPAQARAAAAELQASVATLQGVAAP